MKDYEKISETKFKVSETKTLSSEIDVLEQLGNMAGQLSTIKKLVSQAKDMHIKVMQIVDWYNTRADIINEAKEKVGLATKEVEKVELPEVFSIEELDIDALPTIDIQRDN